MRSLMRFDFTKAATATVSGGHNAEGGGGANASGSSLQLKRLDSVGSRGMRSILEMLA